jgi:hypothetical protein
MTTTITTTEDKSRMRMREKGEINNMAEMAGWPSSLKCLLIYENDSVQDNV